MSFTNYCNFYKFGSALPLGIYIRVMCKKFYKVMYKEAFNPFSQNNTYLIWSVIACPKERRIWDFVSQVKQSSLGYNGGADCFIPQLNIQESSQIPFLYQPCTVPFHQFFFFSVAFPALLPK